jgi:amidase
VPIDRRSFLTAAASATAALAATHVNSFAQDRKTAKPGSSDLAYSSCSDLRAMLDARRISAVELLDHTIKRIESYDSKINAVVVRDFERARAVAREADAALARGERKPLLGIPITVKECFNVAGLPTTWGLPSGRDWYAAEDAVAVARLKNAGAVVLGKSNLATVMADWQSFNAVYGNTSNPWDLKRTAGGSSGGSAAALARSSSDPTSAVRSACPLTSAGCSGISPRPTWCRSEASRRRARRRCKPT